MNQSKLYMVKYLGIMNSKQEEKYAMYIATLRICEEYAHIWDNDEVFKATYNQLKSKVTLIKQNRDIQLDIYNVITSEKQTKRNLMMERAVYIYKRLERLAKQNSDIQILKDRENSISELMLEDENKTIATCEAISNYADNNPDKLTALGISSGILGDFKLSIQIFKSSINKSDEARSSKKMATENIQELIKEVDEILLNRMDLDIVVYKDTCTEFHKRYRKGRLINVSGFRAISIIAKSVDKETEAPLKNVKYTIESEEIASKIPITEIKKSGIDGFLRISYLEEGIYKVTIEKSGYQTQVVIIKISKMETAYISAKLIKVKI